MNGKSLFMAGSLLMAGLAGQAAQAHQWGCWIQEDRNIRIRNGGGSQASAAINDWNSMTILNFSYVSSGEEIFVSAANSGATGWGDLVRITAYDGCTIHRCTAQINTYYYSSTSTAARGMFCQAIGHCLGLDHSNDGGCMGGGYWYDIGTHYTIVQGNINEIGSMYANRIAGQSLVTGEHGGDGHGEESPRFHGNWFYNPRTIREATRMATHVVVATVTGVADGAPIVNRTKDGYVSHIPTQRVSFDVANTRKGDLVPNESFVLFQNGDEQNRFDEDPSYKIGHSYLLFLRPRPDGTYLVLSPEGRYEITPKGLAPATDRSFAPSLRGARIEDVVSDVDRALEE